MHGHMNLKFPFMSCKPCFSATVTTKDRTRTAAKFGNRLSLDEQANKGGLMLIPTDALRVARATGC
jgi:hypothetical protein